MQPSTATLKSYQKDIMTSRFSPPYVFLEKGSVKLRSFVRNLCNSNLDAKGNKGVLKLAAISYEVHGKNKLVQGRSCIVASLRTVSPSK